MAMGEGAAETSRWLPLDFWLLVDTFDSGLDFRIEI
jgi:hypothetical protein